MTTTAADATGAPVEFRVGSRTFLMSPMRGTDQGALDRWAEDYPFRKAEERITQDTPASQAQALYRAAMAESAEIAAKRGPYNDIMASEAACITMLWLSFRRHEEGLTRREVEQAFEERKGEMNATLLDMAMDRYGVISGLNVEGDDEGKA